MKILHTADWHIGNFAGPEAAGQNLRFLDVCNCISALIEKAKEETPDIAIIAGDIFHQAKVWSDRGLKENRKIVEYLRDLDSICPVVVMRGTPNHDSEEQFNALRTALDGNNSINIITEPCVRTFITASGDPIQIAFIPGFDRGYYRAKHPGLSKEEENEVFTEAIANLILGLKAQCESGIPSVLVGHYTIAGANMESGQTAFMSQFEPIVYTDALKAADFDLVCFGHIHRPQQIENCKNTFYSGAVSALNFNDEGQERGFYIHEISGAEVDSTFHELPSRGFKTIRLEDDDIKAITGGDLDGLFSADDFKDKIVRVLYNCTDEHNKAFNHAVLENYLYTNGAFWVQEITPQKITITVDRNALESDDSPETNLAAYLEEKDYKPEEIGTLLELAAPIIAEAVEKTTTERRTGTFVPVEISVKNYRNYRDETFSYDTISFCTINGQNGVGKSSLFMDAMIDCLFEEPREGELTGWICNDESARSGSIMFTFRLGESTYRVTRTRAKSGKATLNIAELVDGQWEDRSKEKYRDTQKEIENIIGMDSLTLKACALIMQDQYGLFLQADKEARMQILGSILGLGMYGTMEDIAAGKLTDTNRDIRTFADKADVLTAGLPDKAEITDKIDEYKKMIALAEAEMQKKQKAADVLRATLNAQLEAEARVQRIQNRITTLTASRTVKEGQKATQAAIITGAEAILKQEAEIAAGVQEYYALFEQERAAASVEAQITAKRDALANIRTDIKSTNQRMREAQEKKWAQESKLREVESILERSDELAEKHKLYEETSAEIARMTADESAYTDAVTALRAAKDRLAEVQRTADGMKQIAESKIAEYERKAAMLESSGCPNVETATCKFLADAQAARADLPRLRADYDELKANLAAEIQDALSAVSEAQKAIDEQAYDPETLKTLRAQLQELEPAERQYIQLEAAQDTKRMITEIIADLQATINTAENELFALAANVKEYEAQIAEAEEVAKSLIELRSKIALAKQWVEKEKQLPLAREKKDTASARLFELISEVEELDKEIEICQSELADESAGITGTDDCQEALAAAEAAITSYRNDIQHASVQIGGLQKQLEQIADRLAQADALQKQINELSAAAAGYDALKRAFSQDGIPHNIIRSIIPVFEATASNILGQMSGGKMRVEFVTEKMLKSNSKKEVTTLDIIINDFDTGRLPYMSRSGGERVKAALSVILALAEIKSSKAGIQLGFLFIDEPPFLDGQGVQAYCDALEAIQRRYSSLKIMAITHDPAMKARFPQSLDVVKTSEGSKVIY